MQQPSLIISKRRGEPNPQRSFAPIFYGIVVVVFVLFFLYIKTLDDVIHEHNLKRLRNEQNLNVQTQIIVKEGNAKSSASTVVLTTKLGDISIQLREDLSKESAGYLKQILESGNCPRCSIYRVQDKGGIVQGIIRNPELGEREIKVPLGECPDGVPEDLKRGNCHGPVMIKGMVGWAGGKSGPDFFIDGYKQPAKFWGTQHTVWGELTGKQTEDVMKQISELPTKSKNGMTYLLEPLKFTMKLV